MKPEDSKSILYQRSHELYLKDGGTVKDYDEYLLGITDPKSVLWDLGTKYFNQARDEYYASIREKHGN